MVNVILPYMNTQFDIILSFLAEGHDPASRFSAIAEALRQAGVQSPTLYLQRLSEDGYVERVYGRDAVYSLTDKGRSFYRTGGFARTAVLKRERRVALTLTILVVILLCSAAFVFGGLG